LEAKKSTNKKSQDRPKIQLSTLSSTHKISATRLVRSVRQIETAIKNFKMLATIEATQYNITAMKTTNQRLPFASTEFSRFTK
jgi:hypothetical protein